VSVRHPDGHYVAMPQESAQKFIVLRGNPALVLAGTSSHSKKLDFSVHGRVCRYVENFPEASFDQVASVIVPTMHETLGALGIQNVARRPPMGKCGEKIYGFLVGRFPKKFFDSTDRMNLNLLGYDREQTRVRNRVFSITANGCDESELPSGATISGFLDPQEGILFTDKLLELIGRERTPQSVAKAMLELAAEISESHRETIGGPYFLHIVTNRASHPGGTIEEQLLRAMPSVKILGCSALIS
jgi:hypothetical protein